ncbi:hypothetical protein [Christiangramia sabulilitoris]|uniref:Uncharacterized protein n=1 Tax=Christiangramia sabulilitoris TaxID=2583991 RepID=A0A550I3T4_9FLAO|nr:hypothetical protein [Christiangramia sabulilitoris]TRO65488.1 hypothetical protein FGM01_08805 [Christiangramia sabulilitoris]
MKASFKTIPEFINLLEAHDLSSHKICTVLEKGFKIFGDENLDPDQLKEQLREYWSKYSNASERPLLLDINQDIEEYLKSQTEQERVGFMAVYYNLKAAKIASLYNNTGMHDNKIFLLGEVVCQFE